MSTILVTGGAGASAPTHRLAVNLSSTRLSVIVDVTTARPELENYGLNVTYTLTEIASGKVVTGVAPAQRLGRVRHVQDAAHRASSRVVASWRHTSRPACIRRTNPGSSPPRMAPWTSCPPPTRTTPRWKASGKIPAKARSSRCSARGTFRFQPESTL